MLNNSKVIKSRESAERSLSSTVNNFQALMAPADLLLHK